MMMRASVRGLKLTPFRDRKLSRLEREALSDPSDSARTLAYLKELGGNNPEEVIRKVEKGDFMPSDGVCSESLQVVHSLKSRKTFPSFNFLYHTIALKTKGGKGVYASACAREQVGYDAHRGVYAEGGYVFEC
mmetsp:Transcript_27641/g.108417  ORF Transcript_27641/g.108417 Transcript_27641/m.108417 type:complete len:133 (-) Transcript_27641:86-484(-)